MPGVMFITGAQLRLQDLTIRVGIDGQPPAASVKWTLRTDMWPQWGREAVDAAVAARDAERQIPAALNPRDDERIAELLTTELRASLRSISASVIAVDAFYAAIKARAAVNKAPSSGSTKTPRHAQIVDLFRHEFRLSNEGTRQLKRILQECFRYRDRAVHPGSRFMEPVLRPDVDAGVDWHFIAFRSRNAEHMARIILVVLQQLIARMPQARSPEVREHAEAAQRAIDELMSHAEAAQLRLNEAPTEDPPPTPGD